MIIWTGQETGGHRRNGAVQTFIVKDGLAGGPEHGRSQPHLPGIPAHRPGGRHTFIAGPASAATSPTCAGLATSIVGSAGDDVLVGTDGADIVTGLGGDDEIHGLGGNDVICGETGADFIFGGDGKDRIYGGGGWDVIHGDAGRDKLFGQAGRDRLFGGCHADRLFGGKHADRLIGDGGPDSLYGGGGPDVLRGRAGDDLIFGGSGVDDALGGKGWDRWDIDDPSGCDDDLNDAPNAADDHFTTGEDVVLTGNLLADDGAGPDTGPNADPIDVTAINGDAIDGTTELRLASGAVLEVTEDGEFSYAVGIGFDVLPGGIIQDGFTYTVADPEGETDEGIAAVLIGGTDAAPIALFDEEVTDEDDAVDIDVLANDTDADEHDLVIVSVDAGDIDGSVTVNADQTVRYTPSPAFTAMADGDEIEEVSTYTITDGYGGSASAAVIVIIEGTNDAPIANDDAAHTDEDGTVVIDVLDNDADVDGSALSAELGSLPAHGTVTAGPAGTFDYAPAGDWHGVDTFTYEVIDDMGARATATVTVAVEAVNDAPIARDDAAAATAGSMIIILVLANDTDVDGDTLQVTTVDGPDHGTALVLSTGALAYTSDAGFSGIDEITYEVTDAGHVIDTATVLVTVSH
jgi:hypothetical protein